ncbi:MAG: hypothetical protein HY040_24110 [Planctomycetes bacterium]|nr:hypothetical protein [Planctomycetota bacterium]
MKRLALFVAMLFALTPLYIGYAGDKAFKTDTYAGKVVPLAELLKKEAKLDDDAAPHWLALVTDSDKIYPLVKDAGARIFFKDAKLLNRPMRLTGRLIPNANLLQVVSVQSLLNGKLHDIYYWCDICTIRAYEPGACGCCGAPLEFREVPGK